MPRKNPALKASPLVQEAEETLLRDLPVPLSLEERQAFRAALKLPAFQKALRNIRLEKPSVFIGKAELNSALGGIAANNRIHEIRGWEMFEAALGKQSLDPVLTPPKAKERYQDESTLAPS